jgi:hypothetical protein
MDTARRIAVLTLREEQGLSGEEERELEGLQRRLGFVGVGEQDFERVWGFKKKSKSESELRALHVEFRRWEEGVEDDEAE